MIDWSVEVGRTAPMGAEEALVEEQVDEFLEVLGQNAPVISISDDSYVVRLSVQAEEALSAAALSIHLVDRAAKRAGFPQWPVSRVDAQDDRALMKELSSAAMPSVVGVAEVAKSIGVSRQRVSELARSGNFPPPAYVLASGPIWLESSVARFVQGWDRRPGRRARPEAVATGHR